MSNFVFVGDPHGDLDFIERAADLAAEHDAVLICVGDWGFLWPRANHLTSLSLLLQRAGEYRAKPPVQMRFCDGNHDDHVQLRQFVDTHSMACSTLEGGGVEIAPNVIYQPRGSTHADAAGTRFLFVGGAPSIDWYMRTPGRDYWPDEECISEEEHARALAVEGPIHVLVTHDAPDYPPGFPPKGDPNFRIRSARSMAMVAELIEKHRPELHVHGHWHSRDTTRRGATKVEGLDCNYAMFSDAVMLWSRR